MTMTAGQRRVIISLAVTVSILAAALAGLAFTGGPHKSRVTTAPGATRPGQAAPTSTDTTVDLVPLVPPGSGSRSGSGSDYLSGSGSSSGFASGSGSGNQLQSSAQQASPPITVPTTTSTTGSLPLVSGAGAVLMPPSPSQVSRTQIGACASLANSDNGWSATGCGLVHATGTDLTWLTESRAAPPGIRAYVFRPAGVSMWNVALVAADDSGTRFSDVKVRVDHIAADGGEDIVFGFHEKGSGSVLSLDLVHGAAVVVDHQDLSHGSARSATGELDTWSARDCYPSTFEHEVIQLVQGAWRVVTDEVAPAASVPPSQL